MKKIIYATTIVLMVLKTMEILSNIDGTIELFRNNNVIQFYKYFDYLFKAILYMSPLIMVYLSYQVFELRKDHEIIRRQNIVMEGVLINYFAHTITLLRENRRENKEKRKVITSLVSNIIIRKSNPGNGGKERTENVHLKWKDSKSFLNVIWYSIFHGLKQSIGIDKYL